MQPAPRSSTMVADRARSVSGCYSPNEVGPPQRNAATASPQPQRASLATMSMPPHPGSTSEPPMTLQSTSRDGAMANGVLLGSLTEYMPVSAVAYAKSTAAEQTFTGATAVPVLRNNTSRDHNARYSLEAPSLSTLENSQNLFEHSTRGARQSGGQGSGAAPQAPFQQRASLDTVRQGSDVSASQALRGSKHSITVLKAAPGGWAQECERSPTANSTAQLRGSWDTPGIEATPMQPPRRASLNQATSTTQLDSGRRNVQVEKMPPIGETSLSTVSEAGTTAELRHAPPQHSSASASGAIVQRTPWPAPPSTTTSSPAASMQHAGSRLSWQSSRGAPCSMQSPAQSKMALTSVNNDVVPQHCPSRNGAVREAGEPLLTGPFTLQVSTTTLTTTCKKVRYLLPSEPFDPDAPDPSDIGGLKAEEEAALLNPVSYTCAVDEVSGRYPMLLRRPSAQGGDALCDRPDSVSGWLGDGAPRPTFLLDDGNRWVRATNRPAVATTRDPSGTRTTQLPAPRILQNTGVVNPSTTPDTTSEPFPAYQRGAADGRTMQPSNGKDAGGYLLQRHVQQIATGKRLVKGTMFQPPSMGKRHMEQYRREQDEDRVHPTAPVKDTDGSAGALAPQPQRQQSGTLERLYDEILRRARQNRRTTLPATIPPAAGPPQALPLQLPGAVERAVPPTTDGRSGRPHCSSAEPAPARCGSRVNPGVALRPPHAASPPRSSSQPCTPICPHERMSSDRTMGSRGGYRPPSMYSAAQREQQASMRLDCAAAAATGGAGPRLPNSAPHTPPAAPPPKRVVPPRHASSLTRGSPPLSRGGRPVGPKQQLDRASSRPQSQPCPTPHVKPGYGVAAAVSGTGGHMPRHRPARFSEHDTAILATPSPRVSETGHLYRSGSARPYNHVSGSHAPPPPPAPAQSFQRATVHASPSGFVPRPPNSEEAHRQQYQHSPPLSLYGHEEGCHAASLHPYRPASSDGCTADDDADAAGTPTAQHTAARTFSYSHDGSRSSNAGHSRTLPLPSAAASASASPYHAAPVISQENDEALMEVSSCTTDTQPIAVSECSEDEMIDEDDGLKKAPPVLVFGDEVFTPEGDEYVEDSDEYATYDEGYDTESEGSGGHYRERDETY